MKNLSYLLFTILFFLFITSCGSDKAKEEVAEDFVENLIEKSSDGKVKVEIDEKGGQTEMTIEGEDGETVSIKSEGNKVPDNFPSDVYIAKGKIESAGIISSGEGESFNIVISCEKGFKDVVSSLTKEMKSKGWTSTMNMNMESEAMQMYTKGKNTATITINGNNGKVEAAYMVTVSK